MIPGTGTTGLSRRRFLHLTAVAAGLPATARAAWAQAYPVRPVRLIVGTPAGGATDIIARLLGEWLSERLARPFVVENRPGASGNIAAEAVVKATPDGHTLLLVNTAHAINATLHKDLGFNLLRDIAPVAGIAREPLVLTVHPSLPARTVPELIAHAKAYPAKLNIASAGSGSGIHLAGELFKLMTAVDMTPVPYRGSAPALIDLLAGQVQVMFTSVSSSLAHLRTGALRPLAVTTAARSEVLPELPTVGEFVTGYEASGWYGIGAPQGIPSRVIDKLHREINAGLADSGVMARLKELGGSPMLGPPADFATLIADEVDKWGKVIRAGNIKAQ